MKTILFLLTFSFLFCFRATPALADTRSEEIVVETDSDAAGSGPVSEDFQIALLMCHGIIIGIQLIGSRRMP